MTRKRLLLADLSVLLVAACAAPPPAPESAPEPASPSAPPFLPGPPGPGAGGGAAMDRASEVLDRLVERRPTEYSGVRINSADSLQMSVPRGPDVARRIAAAQREVVRAKADTAVSVAFVEVKYSRADVLRTKETLIRIMDAGTYRRQFVGVGSDGSLGVAVVYAATGSEAMRRDLDSRYGDRIIFRHMDVPRAA
jgi:hypothetical protein